MPIKIKEVFGFFQDFKDGKRGNPMPKSLLTLIQSENFLGNIEFDNINAIGIDGSSLKDYSPDISEKVKTGVGRWPAVPLLRYNGSSECHIYHPRSGNYMGQVSPAMVTPGVQSKDVVLEPEDMEGC